MGCAEGKTYDETLSNEKKRIPKKKKELLRGVCNLFYTFVGFMIIISLGQGLLYYDVILLRELLNVHYPSTPTPLPNLPTSPASDPTPTLSPAHTSLSSLPIISPSPNLVQCC